MAHQQGSFHPFPSRSIFPAFFQTAKRELCITATSCFLASKLCGRGSAKAKWSPLAWLPHPGLNPRANLPLQPHFRLPPQLAAPASIPVFFQLFWAAIISPSRHGPMACSKSSSRSHTGTATRGTCLSVTSWVEVTPNSLA